MVQAGRSGRDRERETTARTTTTLTDENSSTVNALGATRGTDTTRSGPPGGIDELHTPHNPPKAQLTFLDETPSKELGKRTPQNELSKLSSIYMQAQGEKLNTTAEERAVMDLLDDNYHEILGSEGKQLSFTGAKDKFLPLDMVVPDGTNKTISELEVRFVNFPSPGGGQGSILVSLPNLEQFYTTKDFLIDLDTAEVFVLYRGRYLRTGMSCSKNKYDAKFIVHYIQKKSTEWCTKVQETSETERLVPRSLNNHFNEQHASPESVNNRPIPGLPKLPDPSLYGVTGEEMKLETRRNFIRDRTRMITTYILAYEDEMATRR